MNDSAPRRRGETARAPGANRRPTINDVARLANVSKKTVSRVINNAPSVKSETREAIMRVMHEIGYAPDPQARGLALRRAFLVGLIYDNPNPQYVVNMQQGLLDGLAGSGYELVVHPCNRASPTFLSDLSAFVVRQKLYGVVLTPSASEDERVPPILDEAGCEYVRIASVSLDDASRMIISNDQIGGAAAGRHLIALGHREIGFVSGPPSFRSSHERRRGLETALEEAGLSLPARLTCEGAYTFESGIECGAALLSKPDRPSAIFAANDEMAAGILQAARALDIRVPDELSIVGYDDFEVAARVWPRLTTVRSPTRDIGRMAAEKLITPKPVAKSAEADAEEVVPVLIERASTAVLAH